MLGISSRPRARPSRPARPSCAGVSARSCHHGQRLQAGLHRVGVGVVGVVDDGHAVGAGVHLHAVPRRRARGGQRGWPPAARSPRIPGRPRPRTARCRPDGRRARPAAHRPVDICRVRRVKRGRARSSSSTSSPTRRRSRTARPGPPARRSCSAIAATIGSSALRIDHPGGRNRLQQFGFRGRDDLARAELAEMGGADVEHHRDRRRGDRRQRRDVAGMARRHLQDQIVGVVGRAQHRPRMARARC